MDTLKKYCLELAIKALQGSPANGSVVITTAEIFEDYLKCDKKISVEEETEQSRLKFNSFKEFLDYLENMK